MTNGNDCFAPTVEQTGDATRWNTYSGLTKREYFAAMAMQGLCSDNQGIWSNAEIAEYSVRHADALINELNKQP